MFHLKAFTPVLSLIFASLVVGGRHSHAGVQRRIDLCGGSGYDLGTNAYFYLEDSSLATAPQCGARCLTDSECKTYAVGKGACLFYNTSLTENSRSDVQSPNKFFDRTCAQMTGSLTQQRTSTAIGVAITSTSPITSAPTTTTISSPAASLTGGSSIMAAAQTNNTSVSGTSTATSTSITTATAHASTTTTHTSSASTTSTAASSTQSRTSSASTRLPNNILQITAGLSLTLFSILTST